MTDHEQPVQYMSTTVLAKRISKEAREVFSLLSDGGWLIKVDKRWQLTNKGRFEGGVLLEHPKFGEYVAWPNSVLDHPILRSLPDAQWTATKLAAKWAVPTRLLNLALQDLGLVKAGLKGWLLMPAGKRLGAYQCYVEKTGVPYVSWSDDIHECKSLNGLLEALKTGAGSLSGRECTSNCHQMVDSWLYLQGFHYRSNRLSRESKGDFYFPWYRVSIVISHSSDDIAAVSKRLSMLDALRQDGVVCIELSGDNLVDLKILDGLLSKLLLQAGIVPNC